MDFNQNVDKDVIENILESSLWQKAGIKVSPRADEDGQLSEENHYSEPTDLEELEENDGDAVSFSLEDLQYVLDNLEDEDLMEHALNMLDVFDVAYEELHEGFDPGDEDEEEDEEEEDEEEEEEEEVVSERRKYGGNKGDIPSGKRKKKGHYGRGGKRRSTAREEGEVDYGA